MVTTHPLQSAFEQAGATFLRFGPDNVDPAVQVVETFGPYESEYAAIRKSAGLIELPQRGWVELTGRDRIGFLHRMLTQDLANLQPGQGRRAFLLERTGRIQADVVVLHGSDHTFLAVDRFQAPLLVSELDGFVFGEDVQVRNLSDAYLHLALHGPAAVELLGDAGGTPPRVSDPWAHDRLTIAGHTCVAYRCDETGQPGLHLVVPHQGSKPVYETIRDSGNPSEPLRARPIGWLAYNTARIEAGTPLYHIDFGPDSLPHETGVLEQCVSFSKGCYRGQEIVARMQNLGHPKRVLVGLRFRDDHLPIAGSQVLEAAHPPGPDAGSNAKSISSSGSVVGAITSSCVSPMLGGTAVALAMLKWELHEPGSVVAVPAEGRLVPATVGPLTSLNRSACSS